MPLGISTTAYHFPLHTYIVITNPKTAIPIMNAMLKYQYQNEMIVKGATKDEYLRHKSINFITF